MLSWALFNKCNFINWYLAWRQSRHRSREEDRIRLLHGEHTDGAHIYECYPHLPTEAGHRLASILVPPYLHAGLSYLL